MKQIKTIFEDILTYFDCTVQLQVTNFDERVNKALGAGWTLIKREVIHTNDDKGRRCLCVLYAELEREIAKQAEEQDCRNCKWFTSDSHREPCRSCPDGEKWEPKP